MLAFRRVPVTTGTSLAQTIFLPCCLLNDRRKEACSFFKIGRLSSLLCLFLVRLHLLIFLLLLMSGSVHPNPGPVFPCSVCAGNLTWRGRSVQCCTCSKWVHLKCSLSSKCRTLGSSHFWSCPSCYVPASSGDNTVTSSSDSSSLYTSTVQAAPLLIHHFRLTLATNRLSPFRPLCTFSLYTLTTVSCSWLSLYTFCFLFNPLTPSGFFNGMLRSPSQKH